MERDERTGHAGFRREHREPADDQGAAHEPGVGDKVQEDAKRAARHAGSEVRSQGEAARQRAAEEAEALSEVTRAAASEFGDRHRPGLAHYARVASDNLADVAQRLQERSVEDLAEEARRLARDNPGLFVAGSIAVGFGLGRFMQASTDSTADGSAGHGDSATATGAEELSVPATSPEHERVAPATETQGADLPRSRRYGP